MIKSEANKFGKPLFILMPGDYYATKDDCVLGTVTGATVCVGLYDDVRRIGGMGHFILPGMIGTEGIFADEIAAQGITSMEYLLGEIVKLGGDRRYLKAKIFGAGNFSVDGRSLNGIAASNIRFLREYFALEKIKVETEDLGGQLRRKMLFYPATGVVYRRFQRRNEDSSEFLRLEQEYIDITFRNKTRYGRVILFD
jgi:chemotaxis protein CheD